MDFWSVYFYHLHSIIYHRHSNYFHARASRGMSPVRRACAYCVKRFVNMITNRPLFFLEQRGGVENNRVELKIKLTRQLVRRNLYIYDRAVTKSSSRGKIEKKEEEEELFTSFPVSTDTRCALQKSLMMPQAKKICTFRY